MAALCQLPRRRSGPSAPSSLIDGRILTTGLPDTCQRHRGILIFAIGVQSFAAALGTVGVYRTGASQRLAFPQTGSHLHLINAGAGESHFPPLPAQSPDAAPLLPALVEVRTVFSHT